MCNCECDDFRINGSHLEIFNSEYAEWEAYEINYCPICGENVQPERSEREDFFGMKAEVNNGILTMENGRSFDLSQLKEDAAL